MHQLNVTMLGPRGVGKTTMLASMYERFSSAVETSLQLTPDGESSAVLEDRLGELRSLALRFVAGEGVVGNQEESEFLFGLGKKNQEPSLDLRFRDFPGGWLASRGGTSEERRLVDAFVRSSHVVVVAIDAPALMERDGRWHELVNRPQQIADIIKRNRVPEGEGKLLLLTPIKCEKYMQTPEDAEALNARVKDGYRALLNHTGAPELGELYTVVVTPVQTVGCVRLNSVDLGPDGEPVFRFIKASHNARYQPRDTVQPLRYILLYLLHLHLQQRRGGLFGYLRELFGFNSHLHQAVRDLATGVKTGHGFEVLHGHGNLRG